MYVSVKQINEYFSMSHIMSIKVRGYEKAFRVLWRNFWASLFVTWRSSLHTSPTLSAEGRNVAVEKKHQLQVFLQPNVDPPSPLPRSASVHAGVKREKIPAAVDVRSRGQPASWCPPCLVGGYINPSWRRARLLEKRVKEGRDVLRRVPSARMFACYYCRQIPTSRAADAHYNCKGGPAPHGALSLSSQANIRMHWDVHSEVSRFRVLRGLAVQPTFTPTAHDPGDATTVRRGEKFNIFELEGEKPFTKSIKDEPWRETTYIGERPRVIGGCSVSTDIWRGRSFN